MTTPSAGVVGTPLTTVSGAVYHDALLKNALIKKNVFGHRWVLVINEESPLKKRKKDKVKLVLYSLAGFAILTVISFGVYFSLGTCGRAVCGDKRIASKNVTVLEKSENVIVGVAHKKIEDAVKAPTKYGIICMQSRPRTKCISAKCPNGCGAYIKNCNLETHFYCGNSLICVEKTRKCDGFIDCWDRSDEIGCTNGRQSVFL